MSSKNPYLKLLKEYGVYVEGHFVYAAGDHGREYIPKDILYSFPTVAEEEFFEEVARRFAGHNVDVVIGPAVGGAVMAFSVATCLEYHDNYECSEPDNRRDIRFGFADKTDDGDYIIKRGYDKLIPDKRVLIVEDILNSGGSAAKVVAQVRKLGGIIVGVAAIYNRGGVTKKGLGLKSRERFSALITHRLVKYPEADCPLCKAGVPVNEDFGKGRVFNKKKERMAMAKESNPVYYADGGERYN